MDKIDAFLKIRDRSLFSLMSNSEVGTLLESSEIFVVDAGLLVPRSKTPDTIYILVIVLLVVVIIYLVFKQ